MFLGFVLLILISTVLASNYNDNALLASNDSANVSAKEKTMRIEPSSIAKPECSSGSPHIYIKQPSERHKAARQDEGFIEVQAYAMDASPDRWFVYERGRLTENGGWIALDPAGLSVTTSCDKSD